MKHEEPFDRAVAAVRDETLDPATEAAALGRIRRRLAAAAASEPMGSEEPHRIRGCAGFQALLPAYLAGALTEPKRLLLEDHTRECVPCRRALAEARRGRSAPAVSPATPAARPWRPYAIAASLAGAAALAAALWFGGALSGSEASAEIAAIDGELFLVSGASAGPLDAGVRIGAGERIRTGPGSRALLALADGSRVELAPRSELALASRRDGVALELGRGNLIVEAAPQRDGHLYVATGDCEVAVVGTIFSVAHGAKGSRVSVIEGEVRVAQGARRAVLKPGDQLSTSERLGRVPVGRDFAWSRNADDYAERLQALAALGRELDEALAVPGERTSTRLLDLVPAGTVVYAGLPNLAGSLDQAWSIVRTRVAENPALAEWWQERFGPEHEAEIERALAELVRFGEHLGEEIVVAVDAAGAGHETLLLVAEVLDPAAFSLFLDEEIDRLNAEAGEGARLVRLATPAEAPAATDDTLFVWLAGDLLAISPSAGPLAQVEAALPAAASPFAATEFHDRLAAVYAEGAAWLLGLDLEALLARDGEGDDAALAASGFADLRHLVIESESAETGTEVRALVAFAGERRGIASWIAEPGPMGALEFVSPDAEVAVGGLLKDPEAMLDDLFAMVAAEDDSALAELARFEAEHGLSLREDLAAALGGDFAFAVDGPWLPTPAWKLVVEVADAGRLAETLDRLVEAWNREAERAEAAGETAQEWPRLAIRRESMGGHVIVSIQKGEATLVSFLAHDGYLVAGPQAPLLVEAVDRREAGISLPASTRFRELLPHDGRLHFSAVAWQSLSGALSALGELAAGAALSEQERARFEAASTLDSGPSLAVVYGDADRLTLATSGLAGPLGLSLERLLAFGALVTDAPSAQSGGDGARAVETPVRETA